MACPRSAGPGGWGGWRAWWILRVASGVLRPAGYWSPARTDVMRWVLKPSQCIRPM